MVTLDIRCPRVAINYRGPTNWIGVDVKSVTDKIPPTSDPRCGEDRGYQAHRVRGEFACIPCKDAHSLARILFREARPDHVKSVRMEWESANNERRKRYHLERHKANREKERAYAKEYRRLNPEKYLEATRRWAILHQPHLKEYKNRNRDLYNRASARRTARERGVGHSPYSEVQVLSLYGQDCYLCGEPVDLTAPRSAGKKGWELGLHIEHVVALINGGHDNLENVRPSHGKCNLLKGRK